MCRRRGGILTNISIGTSGSRYGGNPETVGIFYLPDGSDDEPRSGPTFPLRDAQRRAKRGAEAPGQTDAATSAPGNAIAGSCSGVKYLQQLRSSEVAKRKVFVVSIVRPNRNLKLQCKTGESNVISVSVGQKPSRRR
jgi:hypothetical protein